MEQKIDFVITWVDGNDPVWQMDKAKYSAKGADVRKARYRDWDQLKYWFRAVEKYAPWVNKIHFVTYGHLPEWLNVNHPKLAIVNHEDFIPSKYLPVFNSTAIEVHLHRIPGLNEQFVYFCDDFYLMQPCQPEDFFKKGKPADEALLAPLVGNGNCGEIYYYHLYNDYSLYSRYTSRKMLLRNWWKYVNFAYGKGCLQNLWNLLAKNMNFRQLHLPFSYLKSSFELAWEDYPEVLINTANSRFRQVTDNSSELFRGIHLITGQFYPVKKNGIVVDTREVVKVKTVIESGKYKHICLSDNTTDETFEVDKCAINQSFDIVFPERSTFEL